MKIIEAKEVCLNDASLEEFVCLPKATTKSAANGDGIVFES